MAHISATAQIVWDRFCGIVEEHGPPRLGLAAALCAVANQVVPEQQRTYKDEVLIDSLHLSTRTENALKRGRVFSVGDLKAFTYADLLRVKGMGVGSVDEVVDALTGIGVSLLCSAQERRLSWADVIARREIRAAILAIAAELEGGEFTRESIQ